MFHHFPDELGVDDYLVRSTEFTYDENPIASFITGVVQSGYVLEDDGTYLKRSLPPLDLEYSKLPDIEKAEIEIKTIDAESLENLPYGLDGTNYQWADLDGEGISGILTEQAGAWFYKPNLGGGRFGGIQVVESMPSLAALSSGQQQFMDLAGDGQLDLVRLGRPMAGFFERTLDQHWETFIPFRSSPNIAWNDPNLKFVDLTGDGHADVIIAEDQAFIYYPSLAEEGFGPSTQVSKPHDEEMGPRLVLRRRHPVHLSGGYERRWPDGSRPHPQWRGLLLAQPGLRSLWGQGDHGQCPLVRLARTVQPAAHQACGH